MKVGIEYKDDAPFDKRSEEMDDVADIRVVEGVQSMDVPWFARSQLIVLSPDRCSVHYFQFIKRWWVDN